MPGANERLTYPKLAFAATKTQDVACDAAGNYSAKFKAVITNGTDFVTPPIVPPAVIGGGNRYKIKVTYRTANTQENRVSGTFAAPAGSTLVTGSPADTSVHSQDITVALPALKKTYPSKKNPLGISFSSYFYSDRKSVV